MYVGIAISIYLVNKIVNFQPSCLYFVPLQLKAEDEQTPNIKDEKTTHL